MNEEQSVSHAKRAGLYFSHPACLEHDPRVYMPEHPDTPDRLQAIEQALARARLAGLGATRGPAGSRSPSWS